LLDVGQGTSWLLDTGSGLWAFDAGPAHRNPHRHALVAATRLYGQGLRRVLLSHDDSDHTGGLACLLDAGVSIDTISYPAGWHPCEDTRRLLAEAVERGAVLEPLAAGCQIGAPGVRFRVIWPPSSVTDRGRPASAAPQERLWESARGSRPSGAVDNYWALAGVLDLPGLRVLLTSDCPAVVEDSWLPGLLEAGGCDVLELAHHGSAGSSSFEFIRALNPKLGVLACGRGNPFGHPSRGVVASLASCDVPLLRTDLDGPIVLVRSGRWVAEGLRSGRSIALGESHPHAALGFR